MYRVLSQYLQGIVPEKAGVASIQFNPLNRGKIRLNYNSLEKPEKPFIQVKFDVRQTYGT